MIPDDCSLLIDLCQTEKKQERKYEHNNTVAYILTFATVLILSFFFSIVKPSDRSCCSHALLCSIISACFLTFVCTLLYSKVAWECDCMCHKCLGFILNCWHCLPKSVWQFEFVNTLTVLIEKWLQWLQYFSVWHIHSINSCLKDILSWENKWLYNQW